MKKGFFGSLFDFSFTSFIAPKLIPVLYVLGIIAAVGLFVIYLAIGSSLPGGYGGLIVVPALIVAVLTIIFARVWSETIMVTFRVYDRVSGGAGSAVPAVGSATPPLRPAPPASPPGSSEAIAQALRGGDTVEKLTRLKALLDVGTITREGFERLKARVLSGG